MELPIDARKVPFLQKYLDETKLFAPWVIFGYHDDGTVDIHDGDDVIINISPEKAKCIIEARDTFVTRLYVELCLD